MAKEICALRNKFRHYTAGRWNNNGYVLLAYWICTNNNHIFGDFHFDTPDEWCMTKDEFIFAFWSCIRNQEHLFGEVEQSSDSSPEISSVSFQIFVIRFVGRFGLDCNAYMRLTFTKYVIWSRKLVVLNVYWIGLLVFLATVSWTHPSNGSH